MTLSTESPSNILELGRSSNQLVPKKRKRYNKLFYVLTIAGLLVVGYLVVFYFQNATKLPTPESQKLPSALTFEAVMDDTFYPHRFNGTWVSDDEILLRDEDGYIILYNVTNGISTEIINDRNIVQMAGEIMLSADKKYLMVAFGTTKIYRHSAYSQYLVIDILTQKQTTITNSHNEPVVINLVKWSPKGNGFAYIYLNNIYYRSNAVSQEDYKLTDTGNATTSNGLCDWVYEEEIFSDTNAMWFSPEGDKLAYASFNDVNVDVMFVPYYGEPGTLDSQYPKLYNIRYPKPGRPNPIVKLFIADLVQQKKSSREISFSHLFTDPILSSVTWISNTEISVTIMNRVQNKAYILSCSVSNVPCEKTLYLESRQGWLNLFTPPLYSSGGQYFVFIHPWDQGNHAGSFRHLTLHDRTMNVTRPITAGKFTVTDILAWDPIDKYVYFQGTQEGNPRVRYVYRMVVDGNSLSAIECLSCLRENICTFATASLSKQNSYFIETCSGPGVPVVSIYDKSNNKVMDWEDNIHLEYELSNTTLPESQYLEVAVTSDLFAQVKLLLPPNMDKSGNTKYPMLVNVYAGPDSNQVFEKFKIGWESYFCVQNNVIIAFIDGRGSGLKGDKMLFANYRRLGSSEIEDQINVTRQLQNEFGYIDRKRCAIWGWSYGGYASGMVLAMDHYNVFKCGASVAPVTDWIYYDSMYTERFLGLPFEKDNKRGYVSSSLLKKATNLAFKKYLLIHGTMDDNVHYQQSMMLARVLEVHDILFEQQSYPDEAHSIAGSRHHLYHTLEAFLFECFI